MTKLYILNKNVNKEAKFTLKKAWTTIIITIQEILSTLPRL